MFWMCLFVCLSRINWKDYESQKVEKLDPGVILYCDNDLLVFEAKFGIVTSQLRKTYLVLTFPILLRSVENPKH